MVKINADLHAHLRDHTQKEFDPKKIEKIVEASKRRLGNGSIIGLVNFIGKNGEDRNFELFSHAIGSYERCIYKPEKGIIYLPKEDITFIRGHEIETNEGNLLGFFIPENSGIYPRRDWRDILKRIRNTGAIVGLPCPYFLEGIGYNLLKKSREDELDELFNSVDFMEVFNGESSIIPGRNESALEEYLRISKKRVIGAIGTSDSYSVMELADVYTQLTLPMPARGLLDVTDPLSEMSKAIKNSTPRNIFHYETIAPIIGSLKHRIKLVKENLI